MEIHILEACDEHEFHDLQFGFVGSRSTSMAAALTHDVIDYCVSMGSPVYVCALDAEGAFDGIPHSIMFNKAMDIVPDMYWRILVFWYRRLVVQVKWGGQLSVPITIRKGTRQGGLSSPFIFNLLYQDLVTTLSDMPCGLAINGITYNLCCYADDLLLCSLTILGLQKLIDKANSYICLHGLRFNPAKTTCAIFGKSRFRNHTWTLEGSKLVVEDKVKHLGVILANNGHSHAESRIKSTRRAFYSLQGAGLCQNGTNPNTVAQIFSTAVRPVLTFGLGCVYNRKTVLSDIESLQGKLLKAALGIKKYCRNAPLLQAMNIHRLLFEPCIRVENPTEAG